VFSRVAIRFNILFTTLILLLGTARSLAQSNPAVITKKAPIKAVVSIPPLKGILLPLLPEGSTIEILIPPGVSEHGFEIPPTKLAAVARADFLLFVGLGLEPQVEKLVRDHPRAGRIDFGFADAVGIKSEHEEEHDHKDGEEHHHASEDPHLWLDASLVKVLIEKLDARLNPPKVEATPIPPPTPVTAPTATPTSPAPALSDAAKSLIAKVDEIDAAYRTIIAAAPRKTFIVGHDAWSRLSSRYNLITIPIAGLNASEPKPSAIAAAATAAREKGVTTVFVEPQLSQTVARRIAANSRLKVEVLDPLGNGDWFAMMKDNLDKIAAAIGSPASGKK